MTKLLSQQIFVTTNIILSRQTYFGLLLQQKCACRDKIVTNIILLRQKFCRSKHTFVVTRRVLSRQTRVCCDKDIFVVTKIRLVAAPANDSISASCHCFNAQGHRRVMDLHNYIYSLACCPTDHKLTTHQHPQWNSYTELFQTKILLSQMNFVSKGLRVRLRKSALFVFNA